MADPDPYAADPASPDVTNAAAYAGADAEYGAIAPTNMAPATSAGAAAIGVYSAFQAASQTKRLASFNALYAQREEAQTEAAAQTSEAARGGMGAVMEGRANAALAAQGVGPGGTGAAVKSQLRSQTVNDQMMIEANARREAYGQEDRARAGILESQLAGSKDKQQAASTLLDTAAQEELEQDPRYAGFRGRGVSYAG